MSKKWSKSSWAVPDPEISESREPDNQMVVPASNFYDVPPMKFCRFPVLALALLCASDITCSQSLDPDASTRDVKSAAEIDREWQISVAQFNAKPSRILYDLDRQMLVRTTSAKPGSRQRRNPNWLEADEVLSNILVEADHSCSSLIAQRHHRIDLGAPACRNVTRHPSDDKQHDGDTRKCEWIRDSNFVKQVRKT